MTSNQNRFMKFANYIVMIADLHANDASIESEQETIDPPFMFH